MGETSETQIEERLGVEALAVVIMNFDSDCIEEYESLGSKVRTKISPTSSQV